MKLFTAAATFGAVLGCSYTPANYDRIVAILEVSLTIDINFTGRPSNFAYWAPTSQKWDVVFLTNC